MFDVVFFGALFVAAFLAAVFAYVVVIGAVQLNRQSETGWFHLTPYVILFTVALYTVTSGRDLGQGAWALVTQDAEVRISWVAWLQRGLTLFLLVIASERIASAVFRRYGPSTFTWLLPLFLMYWCCAVASPALFGKYPHFSYEYLYPLVIGVAGLLVTGKECTQFVVATRNATLWFITVGALLIPVKTGMVLETNYSQGFIPGLPRLAGLAPHALQLGLIVQISLLTLWFAPLRSKLLNFAAWFLCLMVLFLAQSKTAWISFSVCVCVLILVRRGTALRKWIFDPSRPLQGVVSMIAFFLLAISLGYIVMFSHLGDKVLGFLDTKEGATLLTLNGRDQIWEIAFQEWERNPVFGYGPTFLNLAHRTSIGLLNATHAHNQFVDDLARAGLVGASALVVYAIALFALAMKYVRVTQGLTIALYAVLFFRGISEIPLAMYGYGSEFAAHLLLLMVIAMAIRLKPSNSRVS